MTFKEMQNFVLDEIKELNQYPDVHRTRIKYLLNLTHKELAQETMILEKSITKTTVADTLEYTDTAFDNILQIIRVRYKQPLSSENGYLLKPYPGGFSSITRDRSFSTRPSWYWVRNPHNNSTMAIGTWPIISEDSGSIVIDCNYIPADMSADSDKSDFKATAAGIIWRRVARDLYKEYLDKNPRVYSVKIQILENDIQRVLAALLNNTVLDNYDQFPQTLNVYI